MTTVEWKVVKQFFDKKAVTNAVDRATVKVLNRGGARVRIIMRRSLRRSKKKSLPGQPPRIHAKGFGLKTILYAYNPNEKNVIIGPVGKPDSDVPNKLEFSGRVKVRRRKRSGGKVRVVRSTAHMEARPFAGPAEESYRDSYPDEWRNAIV